MNDEPRLQTMNPRFFPRKSRALPKASPRTKLRFAFVGVLLLVLFAGVYDYPAIWNRTADAIGAGLHDAGVKWKPPALRAEPFLLGLDLQGGTHLVYDADVSQVSEKDRGAAVEGVRDVIERRVNAFGVAEPIVQTVKSGGAWRVIVEIAGVTDVAEAIRMIGETPFLEFKEEGPVAPIREPTKEELQGLAEWNKAALERANAALARVRAGEDFAALVAEFTEESAKEIGGDVGFIGNSGGFEPVFARLSRVGARAGTILKEVVEIDVGYGIYRVVEARKNPETGATEYRVERIFFPKKSVRDIIPSSPWKVTGLGGKQLASASVIFDPTTGEPQVSLNFNDEGKALFAEITALNVGKLLAIFLDGQPISIPRVSEPITGGSAVVSGTFDIREAKLLAQRLNAGALPVPITLVSQQTVGASLGKASLDRSLFAGLIGFALVALFMALYYRLPGVLSVGALTAYAALVLALFKFIPVTLTLAGIAGFILSVGMAVDANVLIFERLKEELRLKKTVGLAVDEAFRRAWPSIRDGNLTTLLSCAVLFWFSESLVRGFALTLGIGVLLSMFSAISVTRVFLKFIAPHVGRLWWYGVKASENLERST